MNIDHGLTMSNRAVKTRQQGISIHKEKKRQMGIEDHRKENKMGSSLDLVAMKWDHLYTYIWSLWLKDSFRDKAVRVAVYKNKYIYI